MQNWQENSSICGMQIVGRVQQIRGAETRHHPWDVNKQDVLLFQKDADHFEFPPSWSHIRFCCA
jgi:hypothetical protein